MLKLTVNRKEFYSDCDFYEAMDCILNFLEENDLKQDNFIDNNKFSDENNDIEVEEIDCEINDIEEFLTDNINM